MVLATLNVVGGYAVTDRMLGMFRKAPVRDAAGKPAGAVAAFVDITPQKELQRELDARRREAEEASVRKTRFLAAASHDLRQPIHALSLFSGSLLMRPMDGRTAAIARHMNLTQGALFRHFSTKDAIWQAVMEWVATRLLDRLERAAAGIDSPGLTACLAIVLNAAAGMRQRRAPFRDISEGQARGRERVDEQEPVGQGRRPEDQAPCHEGRRVEHHHLVQQVHGARLVGGGSARFHGLAQWLGWLWPYAVLVYVLLRVSRREAPPTIPA
mgnify:CR=1 FL=1